MLTASTTSSSPAFSRLEVAIPAPAGGSSTIHSNAALDIKFLLLHDTKADDAIRQFFTDAYELYMKTLMNPFYEIDLRITSIVFDSRIRGAAKKYL